MGDEQLYKRRPVGNIARGDTRLAGCLPNSEKPFALSDVGDRFTR